MSVEIEFVGGPADAKRLVIDADSMNPAASIEIDDLSPISWSAPQGAEVLFRKARYIRAANPLDDGPLWHYRFDATA